jgi:hypothetical protein
MVVVALSRSEFSSSTIEASNGTVILLKPQSRQLACSVSTLGELSC